VMEGKAVLYDAFAGISAVPILVDTPDADEFIETVLRLAKTFGGIHLEDIRVPDCFRIEAELQRRLDKPVMHDDQHGTAVAALAAVINACTRTGRDLKTATLGQIGLGAAGSAIARLAGVYGVGHVMVTDLDQEAVARAESEGAQATDLKTLMQTADIVIATTGRPGLIRPEHVRPGQVIFALSNPEPEIHPEAALEAGAALAFDGRSINNALAFPGLFKAALETRSRSITREMMVAAAEAIAQCAGPTEVVPSPLDPRVHEAVRMAAVACATAQGLVGTARV
jgi:malate dehydrogenase (oxaloacetate-decarboxylating)